MKYLYFSAQWCQPCKTLAIMNEVSSIIEVEKIDVDEDYERGINNMVLGISQQLY